MIMVACSLCWECQESWKKLYGELCVQKSTFAIEGALGDGVLRNILGLYEWETIEMFYTYSFMSNFQGEKITKKGRSNGNLEFVVW